MSISVRRGSAREQPGGEPSIAMCASGVVYMHSHEHTELICAENYFG